MSETFDASAPSWDLPIIGYEVVGIRFGGELWILANGSHDRGVSALRHVQITLATRFTFISSDGIQHELDGGGEWSDLVPIFDLRTAVITTAVAHGESRGTLSVAFSSGSRLTAPPHREGWEAWGVVGPDAFKLHC